MKIKNIINENYDMEDDQYMIQQMSDSRRPRLTLRHLNKLRTIKDMRRIEKQARAEFVKIMYAAPAGGDEGGGMF